MFKSLFVNSFKSIYLAGLFFLTVPNIIYGLVAYEFHQEVEYKADKLAAQKAKLAEMVSSELVPKLLLAQIHTDYENLRSYQELLSTGVDKLRGLETRQVSRTIVATLGVDEDLRETYFEAVIRANALGGPGPVASTILGLELDRAARLQVFSLGIFKPAFYTGLPTWALTLVVTVLAGILGSVIFVLQAVLRTHLDAWRLGEKRNPWPLPWFFLRPLLGVVTALGGYVVAQTGLLGLNGGIAMVANGDEPLHADAYVMVFVGLTSGLLCWHMIEFIERKGKQMLGSRRLPAWGYGLSSALDAAEARGGSRDDIARKAGVGAQVLDDWETLRTPVPRATQIKLATALGFDPDVLFLQRAPWERGMSGIS